MTYALKYSWTSALPQFTNTLFRKACIILGRQPKYCETWVIFINHCHRQASVYMPLSLFSYKIRKTIPFSHYQRKSRIAFAIRFPVPPNEKRYTPTCTVFRLPSRVHNNLVNFSWTVTPQWFEIWLQIWQHDCIKLYLVFETFTPKTTNPNCPSPRHYHP